MTTRNILQFHREKGRRYRHQTSSQTAVSARLDTEIIEALANEASVSGIRRNSLLNMAVQWYIQSLDDARRNSVSRIYGDTDDLSNGDLEMSLAKTLPCSALSKLLHASSALNCTVDELAVLAIERLLKDFDNKPFDLLADLHH